MTTISPSAQKVQDALHKLGVNCHIIEFTESTRTAQEAADRVGCQLGQIVKSLIFKGKASNKGILVLTSGANLSPAALSRLGREALTPLESAQMISNDKVGVRGSLPRIARS